MLFKFLPTTGGEKDAIPVINIAARDLCCEQVKPWIMFRTLHAVCCEDESIASDKLSILHCFDKHGAGNKQETWQSEGCRDHTKGYPEDWFQAGTYPGGRSRLIRDAGQDRKNEKVGQHGCIAGAKKG